MSLDAKNLTKHFTLVDVVSKKMTLVIDLDEN